MKIKGQRLVLGIGVTLERPGALQPAGLPDLHQLIQFAVREQWVLRNPLFRLLLEHHLNGIMQQRLGHVIGRLAHEDPRARMLPHQQRQGPGVIMVGVTDHDGIDRVELQFLQLRQPLNPLTARMHARIKHDASVRPEIEEVGIRADLVGAG